MSDDTPAGRKLYVDVVIEDHRYGARAQVISTRAIKRFSKWGPSRVALATVEQEILDFMAECAECGFVIMDQRTNKMFNTPKRRTEETD